MKELKPRFFQFTRHIKLKVLFDFQLDTAFNRGQSLFSTADWSKKGWRKFPNCLFKKHFILSPPLHCTIFAYFCLHVLGLRCRNHIKIAILQICSPKFLRCFVIQPRKCQIRWETLPALAFVCFPPSSSLS